MTESLQFLSCCIDVFVEHRSCPWTESSNVTESVNNPGISCQCFLIGTYTPSYMKMDPAYISKVTGKIKATDRLTEKYNMPAASCYHDKGHNMAAAETNILFSQTDVSPI